MHLFMRQTVLATPPSGRWVCQPWTRQSPKLQEVLAGEAPSRRVSQPWTMHCWKRHVVVAVISSAKATVQPWVRQALKRQRAVKRAPSRVPVQPWVAQSSKAHAPAPKVPAATRRSEGSTAGARGSSVEAGSVERSADGWVGGSGDGFGDHAAQATASGRAPRAAAKSLAVAGGLGARAAAAPREGQGVERASRCIGAAGSGGLSPAYHDGGGAR